MNSHILRKSSLLVGAALAFVATASAQVIVCDNFSYPDGSLVPNGGWANHSGTPGDLLVSGGQVVVQHGTPSEDANLSFTPIVGDIYFGIDFTVPDQGTPIPGTDNEYFAHFKDTGFNFAARMDIVPPTMGVGDFSVGIASDDSVADVIWATDLFYDVTYRATVRYDQIGNIAELWIDAAVSTDTSIVGDDKPDPGDTISAFALRQSDSDLNESVLVDNLLVGATFDSVQNISASATLRNAGTNPASYTLSAAPVMGSTITASVDVGSTGHSLGQLVGFAGPLTFGLSGGQTLLVDVSAPGGELLVLPALAGPIATYSLSVPADCSLFGFSLSTQAVHLGGAPFVLSNAQDLVLGN